MVAGVWHSYEENSKVDKALLTDASKRFKDTNIIINIVAVTCIAMFCIAFLIIKLIFTITKLFVHCSFKTCDVTWLAKADRNVLLSGDVTIWGKEPSFDSQQKDLMAQESELWPIYLNLMALETEVEFFFCFYIYEMH